MTAAAAAGVGAEADAAAAARVRRYETSATFRGHTVSLLQTPRERDEADGGQDNTGWCVWQCSAVVLRYLEDDARLAALSPRAGASTGLADLPVVDLSAGAGLVSLALAAAGARVTATDVPAQLGQLVANLRRAGHTVIGRGAADESGAAGGALAAGGTAGAPLPVTVEPYFWGEPLEHLLPSATTVARSFGVVLASDILFIALRDKREAELARTLRWLTRHSDAVVFAFEERLVREETAFMRALSEGGGADAVSLWEAPHDLTVIDYEDSLKGAGGHPDTDLWNPSLFYEPPPIKLFVLRAPPAGSSDGTAGATSA